jgi:hypothetical protein
MKIMALVVLLCTVTGLMAEEFTFEIIHETPYYYLDYPPRYAGMMKPGDEITTTNNIAYRQLENFEREVVIYFKNTENINCFTLAKNLVPKNSISLFTDDIFSDDKSRSFWVPAYFVDVLRSLNRENIYIYEEWIEGALIGQDLGDIFSSSRSEVQIYNSGIVFGGDNGFIIANIEKTTFGFIITCMKTDYTVNYIGATANWNIVNSGILQNLLLKTDGDYINIYVNDETTEFLTIVRVNHEFINQFDELIKTNTCDLTNVVWPRRADKQIEAGKPYRTAEILKLRVNEDRNSEIIMEMPENTAVPVLETGAADTIDDIKANWVKVRLEDGREGWCFGGYLFADIPVEAAGTRQTNAGLEAPDQEETAAVVAQQPETTLLLSIVLVIAGAAAAALVVVLLVRRKK